MIKISIRKVNNKVTGISIKGHAESAPEGQDLVCAGVSTCFLGALKAIKDQNQFQMDYAKGNGEVLVKGNPSAHDQVVLEVLLEQLTFIAEQEPQFVKIETLK